MAPEVGSAPTSPPLQGGANLPQLLGGGRPGRQRSCVFRLSAGCSAFELRDVEMAEGVGNAPTSVTTDPVFETGAASLYLPAFHERGTRTAECGTNACGRALRHSTFRIPHSEFRVAARVGLAPTPCGLTNRRATLTPPGNGAAGRTPTCIVPFRRRMPRVFGHGSDLKRSERQDFRLRPPGPRPGALKTELRSDQIGGPEGACTLNPPADNGALCLELRVQKWWAVMVMLQSSASGSFCDAAFTVRQPGHVPEMVAGVGVAPTKTELMRLA